MRFVRAAALLFTVCLPFFACAQSFAPGHQSSRDPLTDSETEEIRRSTDVPVERVKVYVRFLDERSTKISQLQQGALVEHRGLLLHDAIERFAGLCDELQNNLDEYQDYQTNNLRPVPDLRKQLPELQKSVSVWQGVLSALPANGDYDFALETANEGLKSLKDQAAEMIVSQEKYFAEKKQQDKEKLKQQEKPYALP